MELIVVCPHLMITRSHADTTTSFFQAVQVGCFCSAAVRHSQNSSSALLVPDCSSLSRPMHRESVRLPHQCRIFRVFALNLVSHPSPTDLRCIFWDPHIPHA